MAYFFSIIWICSLYNRIRVDPSVYLGVDDLASNEVNAIYFDYKIRNCGSDVSGTGINTSPMEWVIIIVVYALLKMRRR